MSTSINQIQSEQNHLDLIGKEAVEKIKDFSEKAHTCFFCTKIRTGESFSARPMTVQKTDDEGNLWFLSANDSTLNHEIAYDSYVQLLFQGSSYSDFLNIYGRAIVNQDKAIIKELWKPIFKTWFTEGEDDPRITVIKIYPQEGYYWDTKHNMAVGFIKRLVGAAIGKTMDDSIEGSIKV
ncbi:MAG: pyridoxamine 5'-phosphate oxidase family protein [Bacteroidota bacterium]